MKKEPILDRFWKHVRKTDTCWLWTGHLNKKGRAQFELYRGVSKFAHRFAYELLVGEIPEGMYVCHHCDVPSCVNPQHLFVGTQDDNMKDMVAKGRSNKPKGESNGRAKLDDEAVRFIRSHYKFRSKTHNQKHLARMFGVCLLTIQEVIDGRKWSHVQQEEKVPPGEST